MQRRAKTQAKGPDRFLRARVLFVGGVLIALVGVVLARAAQVQLLDRTRLSRIARSQTRREIEWTPRRGLILDRRGQTLAGTQDVDSIFADPTAFGTDRERQDASSALARALHMDRKNVLRHLVGDHHFVWLKRRVDDAAAERVRALAIDGIELVKEPKRFYPQRALAGHLLGFVGEEKGLEGVERFLDADLRGEPIKTAAVRDARGRMVLESGAPDLARLTGATATLTIDNAIQLTTEQALNKAVENAHAAAGWAVVMDVRTGALLAVASNPSFDANQPGRDPDVWRNRAVQDQLEPGSTIKSFVVAAALEQGALRADELIDCESGKWLHLNHTFHDEHPMGRSSIVDILVNSSNIGAAKIGERLGKERLIGSLRAFGFGERVANDFPSEGKGSLRDPARMPQISVDTTAFGQGMSATGLQTVAAMAAIANGGVLLRPYLVERVVSSTGEVKYQGGRQEVRRVLSPATSRAVSQMLEEVVRRGTGAKAAVPGFRVAGKTGTAQKVDSARGGYGKKRLASFLGFLPADAPRVAILVAVDEPEGDPFGASRAAPAWHVIAEETMRQLGVAPTEPLLASATVQRAASAQRTLARSP